MQIVCLCILLVWCTTVSSVRVDVTPHKQMIIDMHNEYRKAVRSKNMQYLVNSLLFTLS